MLENQFQRIKTLYEAGEYSDSTKLAERLVKIAPDVAEDVVVSHPDRGWHELRERIEADLRGQGGVLADGHGFPRSGELQLLERSQPEKTGRIRARQIEPVSVDHA